MSDELISSLFKQSRSEDDLQRVCALMPGKRSPTVTELPLASSYELGRPCETADPNGEFETGDGRRASTGQCNHLLQPSNRLLGYYKFNLLSLLVSCAGIGTVSH